MKLGNCMKEALVGKIREKKARLVVMGLGRVGLPTAAVLANKGFHVTGVDIRQEIIRAVSLGRSHFMEPDLEKIIRSAIENGKLKVTDDPLAVKKADTILICVQTPLTEHRKPDLSYLRKACKSIATNLSPGKLVIVKSSIPPGTTRNVVAKILEAGSGLKCGKDFWLAHCPERLTPGEALRDFTKRSRIIGGYDETSAEIAAAFYQDQKTLITDSTTAEVAKLSENTFRDVNIAFANELALICEKIGADIEEVRRLANTHPRVNIHEPGCGVGGPCLPKDPFLLLYSVDLKGGSSSKIIESSGELNDNMPLHIVEMVVDALRKAGKRIKNSRIAVLGSAYKAESDEGSNSPTEKIVRALMDLGGRVVVHDPYCDETFGAKRAEKVEIAAKRADCLVMCTDHLAYKKLDLELVKDLMNEKPVIVDGRRILDPVASRELGFDYHGLGRAD